MLKKILLYFNLLFIIPVFGQNYASSWYFGEHAGLRFDGDVQTINNPEFIAEAGCTVICDSSGVLMFYTNGESVWNRNHFPMFNGDSLKGSPQLNQNSIIIPLPESNDIYYLFTISNKDTINGFHYSVVDMNLDNGLGGIIEKNTHIKNGVLEKITGVEHCNDKDYWVVIHDDENNFLSYLVDKNGLSYAPVSSSVGSKPKADVGSMKISPRGDLLVLPINDEDLLAEVFDYDNETGIVSSPRSILASEEDTHCYGTAYSPSGDKLYLSTRGKDYSVWQYNLSHESDLTGSRIATGNNFAMQLGPDGIIYIACENRSYLNAIVNPNEEGKDCSYVSQALELTNSTSLMGLPNFVQSWFYKANISTKNLCLGDTTVIELSGSYIYDSCQLSIENYNGQQVFGTSIIPAHFAFTEEGSYFLNLKYFHCGVEEKISNEIIISSPPVSTTRHETFYGGMDMLTLDAGEGYDHYLWNSGGIDRYETVYNSGIFTVKKTISGCSSIDTIIVEDQIYHPFVPNAFTPNNDGKNDCFGIINPLSGFSTKIMVFSRDGVLLFESSDPYVCWNGEYMGKGCPMGSYIYKLVFDEYLNGQKRTVQKLGTITLLR